MPAIHVAILADVRLYREGLADLLTRHGVEVLGTAADGTAGIAGVRTWCPDVALIDMAMVNGMATLQNLRGTVPAVRSVVLGLPETEADVLACAEAGAAGYIPREGSVEDLIGTLHRVVRGETLCSPRIVGSLFRRVATLAVERRSATASERLTARESEIVELIRHGLSNREIAGRLCIELSTVKNHVHNILEKLQVRCRTEVAAWATAGTGGRR